MRQNKSSREAATETFQNHTEMTEREAEVYVMRELIGANRSETAMNLGDISESTVDTLHQRAKKKAELPRIDVVKRESSKNTGSAEGLAYEIWFENEAMLRYVWNEERGEIREEVFAANDPRTLHDGFDVGGSEDELAEYAMESIEQYTRNYQDDIDALERDWSPLYEALTCHKALP